VLARLYDHRVIAVLILFGSSDNVTKHIVVGILKDCPASTAGNSHIDGTTSHRARRREHQDSVNAVLYDVSCAASKDHERRMLTIRTGFKIAVDDHQKVITESLKLSDLLITWIILSHDSAQVVVSSLDDRAAEIAILEGGTETIYRGT